MPLSTCKIIRLCTLNDPRGSLTIIEGEIHVPFKIERVYYLHDVPGGEKRGGHAHKQLHQLLIAVSGSFDVILRDAEHTKKFTLSQPTLGLYISPMVWRELESFTNGAVCLACASAKFSEEDYYRDFQVFRKTLLP
jgi:hypothetical protein